MSEEKDAVDGAPDRRYRTRFGKNVLTQNLRSCDCKHDKNLVCSVFGTFQEWRSSVGCGNRHGECFM